MEYPPFTCNSSDPVLDIFVLNPKGHYYNVQRMNECEADWICLVYDDMMDEGPGWHWRVRGDESTYPPGYMTPIPSDEDPEDPPVDPEPEEPVQSGN